MTERRRRHTPEQIVKKLRDAEAMLNSGKDLAVVLQALKIREATYSRSRNQYGGMKSGATKVADTVNCQNKSACTCWPAIGLVANVVFEESCSGDDFGLNCAGL